MKISITVKTNSKRPGIERMSDGSYRVSVNAPPIEGKANEAVIDALADCFSVRKSAVRIVKGLRGKKKVIEVVRK